MSPSGGVVDDDEAPPSRTGPNRGNDDDKAVVTRANEQRCVRAAAVGPRLRRQDQLARLAWAIRSAGKDGRLIGGLVTQARQKQIDCGNVEFLVVEM